MSRPIYDGKGRRRNVTVAFRVSEAEAEQIDLMVALSGLTKQDYITKCLLEHDFTVVASIRMRKAIEERTGPIVTELRRIRRAGDMPDELVESLETITAFVGSFAPEESPTDREDALIRQLKRGGGSALTSTTAAPGNETTIKEGRND